MARFIIRNYGLSRQFPYKGKQVCLSNDQAIEIDDAELAATLKNHEKMHVHDRGISFATPVPPEKSDKPAKKNRKVTVDDAEAVHREKFPDEDEQQQTTGENQPPPPDAKTDTDEIAYADMTVKELQVLAKDRTPPIKTSGLKKDKLIKALEDYDRE